MSRSEKGSSLLGFCKECGAEVTTDDLMNPDYPEMAECPECGHPHTKDELIQ